MGKTLYLKENRGIHVMQDGPSVCIKTDGRPNRRIPARLLEQVVIYGNVSVETSVFLMLAACNIPVTLLNRGNETAVLMPYSSHTVEDHEEQRVLTQTDINVERVISWVRSKRRRVQMNVIKRLSSDAYLRFRLSGFRESDYDAFIRARVRVDRNRWTAVIDVIAGLFRELIIARLLKAGLDPHIGVLQRRENFGLALDICHVLFPEVEIQGLQFFSGKGWDKKIDGKTRLNDRGIHDLAKRFENRRDAITGMTEKLIDDIFELMRELRV